MAAVFTTNIECEFIGVAKGTFGYWDLKFYKKVNGGDATPRSIPIYDASPNAAGDDIRIGCVFRKPTGQEVINAAIRAMHRELTQAEADKILDLKYV